MSRRTISRRGLALGAVLIVALAGSTVALAGKPQTVPVPLEPLNLEENQACAFPVSLAPQPGSKWWLTTFDNGTEVTTGAGRDKITNEATSASVTVSTAGVVRVSPLSSGAVRIQALGATIFYFFPGDQGPYGLVGDSGALYHIVGVVDETLENDVVTSIRWAGKATELCSKID